MLREYNFGREIRTDRRKQRPSTWNSRKSGPREVEDIVTRQKHTEYIGTADDRDDPAADIEPGERVFEARPRRDSIKARRGAMDLP